MAKCKAIAIFGSTSDRIDKAFRKPTFETGALLAKNKITMIFGVGEHGLMGESFRGVRSQNGKVLGITIPSLLKKQCKDPAIFQPGELQVVETLHERKHLMMENADALLIAPGGWGTLDEIASHGVHVKLGDRSKKPVIFLNFHGFWDPLKELLNNMLAHGTIKKDQIDFVDYADSPDDIFNAIKHVQKRLLK